MRKVFDWVVDNWFFKVVIAANFLALLLALYWAYDKWGDSFEPIVVSAGSFGVLLGLFYVNDRVSRPRVRLSIGIGFFSWGKKIVKYEKGNENFSIKVANYSLRPLYIGSLGFGILDADGKDSAITLALDGFGQVVGETIVQSGSSFVFAFFQSKVHNFLEENPVEIKSIYVMDKLENKFEVPEREFKKFEKEVIKKAAD